MEINKKSKREKLNKIFVACAVIAFTTCQFVCAENTAFAPIKQSCAIYLDTSKIKNPLSEINFQSPSEYKKKNSDKSSKYLPIKNSGTTLEKPDPQKSQIEEKKPPKFLPFDDNLDYTPPSKYVKKPQEQPVTKKPSVEDIFAPPVEEENLAFPKIEELRMPDVIPDSPQITPDTYYADAETDDEYQDIVDFEGKTISEIKFFGLEALPENIIYQNMKTHSGSKFNAENLQADLQTIYGTGYFTENMKVEPELNEDDSVCLNLYVEENIKVTNISFNGNSVISTPEIYPFVKSLKNLPQNLNLINDSIENINNYYHEKGYLLASVSSVDDDTDGNLIFKISEGIIEKITFAGNEKTQDYVIERNIMTQPGTVYNEEQIKKDLTKIFATQIFDEVDKKITPSPKKDGEYIVTINVKEASTNSVSIGGGIDNALGVFGSVSINERNFMGKGQQLGLSGMVGSGLLLSDASIKNRMNYQIELNFKEPHFINADNSLISKLYFKDLGSYQVPLAIERRFGLNGVITHNVKSSENIKTSLGLGYEHIYLKEGDLTKISSLYRASGIDMSKRSKQLTGGDFINIAPGVTYSTLDDEFMPREGTIAKAKFIESFGIANIKNTTGRLAGSVTKYIPVFKKSTLSVGAKAGIKVHGSDMPEIMAFRLGGPYNIRGFRMNGVGSGDSFLMASAELQTPIPFFDRFRYDVLKNMRFAFFMDTGRVFDPTISSTLFDRPNSAITMGIGLRMYIPGLGPISVDYGLPLTHVGKYNSKNGYFTFGTFGMYDEY